MSDTLVFMLEQTRKGRVVAFSLCLVLDNDDGSQSTVEAATAAPGDYRDHNEIHLLGAMRGAEHALMERRRKRHETE